MIFFMRFSDLGRRILLGTTLYIVLYCSVSAALSVLPCHLIAALIQRCSGLSVDNRCWCRRGRGRM